METSEIINKGDFKLFISKKKPISIIKMVNLEYNNGGIFFSSFIAKLDDL